MVWPASLAFVADDDVVEPPPPKEPPARRDVRLRDANLRRAAAATNTSLFVAKAQLRAAQRAAAKQAQRPAKKTWDATPLQKLCDNDARHTAAVERRRKKEPADRRDIQPTPALDAARAAIKQRKDAECVGEPATQVLRRPRSVTTRPTSPFDQGTLARALGGPQGARWDTTAPPAPPQPAFFVPQRLDGEERRASMAAMADMGLLTKAVAGLVGSAARTMEVHEDQRRREAGQFHQLAAFQTWQARAQQQLDASLRLQQQQLAATLADWRATVAAHPSHVEPPHVHAPHVHPPHVHHHRPPPAEQSRRVRPAPVPFGGAVPQLPRSDVDLVERLWEKIAEIEDDERAVVERLGSKPVSVLQQPARPPAPVSSTATTLYLPPDGSAVSLPLGVVANLVDRPDEDERPVAPPAPKDDDEEDPWQAVVPMIGGTSRREEGDVVLDAPVAADATQRIFAYRDAVVRSRRLNEAALQDTGLSQTQIIDIIADELVDSLLDATAREVDAVLAESADTILARA